MQLKRSKRTTVEVATGSLNDIMFFLLLFFLIISTMANPSVIKLILPSAKTSETLHRQPVTLDVTADLEYYVNGRLTPFNSLEAALSAQLEGVPERSVVLRCDQSLTLQDIVDVLDIANELKVKVILATKSEG